MKLVCRTVFWLAVWSWVPPAPGPLVNYAIIWQVRLLRLFHQIDVPNILKHSFCWSSPMEFQHGPLPVVNLCSVHSYAPCVTRNFSFWICFPSKICRRTSLTKRLLYQRLSLIERVSDFANFPLGKFLIPNLSRTLITSQSSAYRTATFDFAQIRR